MKKRKRKKWLGKKTEDVYRREKRKKWIRKRKKKKDDYQLLKITL